MYKQYGYCVECGKRVYYNGETNYECVEIGKKQGRVLCETCTIYDEEDSTPIFYVKDGYKAWYSFGTYIIRGEDDESMVPFIYEYARSFSWTGQGYRGAMYGKAPANWISVVDTWFGTLDGYNLEGISEKFRVAWNSQEWDSGLELLVCFPCTSNVCASGLEVYIPDTDECKEAFCKWIGVESLEGDNENATKI